METVIIVHLLLNKQDWKIIRAAMREKHILVKDVVKQLGTTKDLFYDQVRGRKPVSFEFMNFINSLNVTLTYGGDKHGD